MPIISGTLGVRSPPPNLLAISSSYCAFMDYVLCNTEAFARLELSCILSSLRAPYEDD